MKFSIVIPVYNVEEYLGKCIESILCQSFRNFEVIIVDDGAIDISAVLCENCLQDDCRFKVIHKTNGGLSDARNFGNRMCCLLIIVRMLTEQSAPHIILLAEA